MFKQTASIKTALALFITASLAGEYVAVPTTKSPILNSDTVSTGIRSVHLCNCGSDTGHFDTSVIAYYSDDSQSNSGNPPPGVVFTNPRTPYGTPVTWEGNPVSGYFGSSDVTFTSRIIAGAGLFSVGTYAGSGYNGRNFACFRDNNRELWR